MTTTADTKEPRYVDVTPTWRGVLRLLLAAYQDGSDQGRASALAELTRMADLADAYVAEHKKPTT
jgi:hypothetical protein